MNREFLRSAGVADDAIDKIMAEYGKEHQAEKDKASAASAEAEKLKAELETYKAKVTDLEKAAGDHEGVRKELDDLKAKIEAERKAAEEAERDAALTATIKAAFPTDRKFVNEFTETALIGQIKAELGKKENAGKGVSEILSVLTKDKEGIFTNPNPPDMPGMGHVEVQEVSDARLRSIMGLPAKKE